MLVNLFLKNNSDEITKATKKTRKREVIILSIIIYIIYNILYKFKTYPHSQLFLSTGTFVYASLQPKLSESFIQLTLIIPSLSVVR